jgi:short-subunit dehydrogenase
MIVENDSLIVRRALTCNCHQGYKPRMAISGKVAVITGASMGIGEAIAKLFADEGAQVVMLSRDTGRAEIARARIGHPDSTLALACDVRHREEIDRVVGLTMHHFKRIDIWINNAGHGLLDSIGGVKMSDFRELFETNLFGTVDGMQAVIPIMKQQGSGTIVNISSVAGHIPIPFHGSYSGTKFAMNAIGKAARVELASAGINVLTVCPGYVKTDFGANAVRGSEPIRVRPQKAKGISVERVARAVLRGIEKQKREVVVPWTMHPAIKLYQMFPGIIDAVMARMARKGF